ncbi:MAG: hypothetical protein ACREK8_05970 [Gemmatimonadales bacterium]
MGTMIILRLVHIGCGVFWAGGVLFLNFIVGPAIGAAGPDGAKVMLELHRRHYIDKILVVALLTILSGLELMRRDSAGFQGAWFHSSFGIGISTGMLGAIIAFLVGVILIKPATVRMARLGGEMASAAPEARAALGVELAAARGRLIASGAVGSIFVLIAVFAMAVARYL